MKRFMNALLAFVLFVSMSTPMSFAQMSSEDVIDMVNDANAKIEACVADAQEQAAGQEDKTVEKICDKLVKETDKIAKETVKDVAKEGYTVELDYIVVYIGDKERPVVIDPMTVH